jgi:processing peptidase subunit beta
MLAEAAKPAITDTDVAAAKTAHLAGMSEELMGPAGAKAASEELLMDRLHVSAFRDTGLGNPLLGTVDDVRSASAGTLQSFVADNYNSNKMVLSVVGEVDHADVVKKAEAAFGALTPKALPNVAGKPYFLAAELNYRNDEMGPNAYIALGFEGVSVMSSDSVAFDLFAAIIGEYSRGTVYTVPPQISGNRARNEIANKSGVGCAEYYKAFSHQYSDTGIVGFFCVADEVAVEHCVGELIWGYNLLSYSTTDEEVARAKRELMVANAQKIQGNSAAAKTVAKHVHSYGRHILPEEYNMRVNAIDAEEIKRVAWQYLHDGLVSYTALGPTHGLPEMQSFSYGPHNQRNLIRY